MNTRNTRNNFKAAEVAIQKKCYSKKLPDLLSHQLYKSKDAQGLPNFLQSPSEQEDFIIYLEQDFKPHLSRNLHAKLCLHCCQFFSPLAKRTEHGVYGALTLGRLLGRNKANPKEQLKSFLSKIGNFKEQLHDAGWAIWDQEGTIISFRPFLFTKSPSCIKPDKVTQLKVQMLPEMVEITCAKIEAVSMYPESSVATNLGDPPASIQMEESEIAKIKYELHRMTKKKHNYKLLYKKQRKALEDIFTMIKELLN